MKAGCYPSFRPCKKRPPAHIGFSLQTGLCEFTRKGRFISPSTKRHGFRPKATQTGQKNLVESGAHPIAVARVVVVVRVAAGVDIVEVVGIVDIGIALPPVVDSTSARECFVEINLLGITFLCR